METVKNGLVNLLCDTPTIDTRMAIPRGLWTILIVLHLVKGITSRLELRLFNVNMSDCDKFQYSILESLRHITQYTVRIAATPQQRAQTNIAITRRRRCHQTTSVTSQFAGFGFRSPRARKRTKNQRDARASGGTTGRRYGAAEYFFYREQWRCSA